MKLGYVSVIVTVVLSCIQSDSGGQVETVQADQQLPQTGEEGDLLGMLLEALVLKLDRDSELMKTLHMNSNHKRLGQGKEFKI